MEEKLRELMEDQSFLEKMQKAGTAEEASAILAAYGLQISPEELRAAKEQPEGELEEHALDGVAGGCGCILPLLARWLSTITGPLRPWKK